MSLRVCLRDGRLCTIGAIMWDSDPGFAEQYEVLCEFPDGEISEAGAWERAERQRRAEAKSMPLFARSDK